MSGFDFTPGRFAFWHGSWSGYGFGRIASESARQIKVSPSSDHSVQKNKEVVVCTLADRDAAILLAEKLTSIEAEVNSRKQRASEYGKRESAAAIAKATRP